MNSVEQVLLNAIVLLYGILFLLPTLTKVNSLLYLGIAWFVGWGVIGISNILVVMFGFLSTPFKTIQVSIVFIVVVFAYYFRHQFLVLRRPGKYIQITILYGATILLFLFLAKYANYMYSSTDSITNEGLSRTFHMFTVFDGGYNKLYTWLFNLRLPFYVSINNVAYLSGIKVFYSFLSSTTVMIAFLLIGSWANNIKKTDIYVCLWIIACIGLFLSEKHIILHSFYSLSNLPTMAYFTAGIICLDIYRRNRELNLVFLASFFLGLTCIIRKEMFIFSLIPYAFVFREVELSLKKLSAVFIIYTVTAYSWFFWGIFDVKLNQFMAILTNSFKLTGHGGIGISLFCFIANTILFFIISQARIKKTIPFILSFTIVVTLFLCFFTKSLNLSASNLVMLMYGGAGKWGFFWYLFSLPFLVILTLSFFTMRKNQKDYFSVDFFIPLIIISFFLLRIILYASFSDPKDFASGNRMLIHIFPVCVYWVGKIGIDTFFNPDSGSKMVKR